MNIITTGQPLTSEPMYLNGLNVLADNRSSWVVTPSWGAGMVVVGDKSTLEVTVETPAPAVTYTERMSDAVRELRRRITTKFGNRVFKTRYFRPRFEQEGDEALDFLIVQAEIADADPDECADATDELIDFIVTHPDQDVQKDLSIEIFGRNA